MEQLVNQQTEDLSRELVNEAIKELRLDQAILVTEQRQLAEAMAQFVFSLIRCAKRRASRANQERSLESFLDTHIKGLEHK